MQSRNRNQSKVRGGDVKQIVKPSTQRKTRNYGKDRCRVSRGTGKAGAASKARRERQERDAIWRLGIERWDDDLVEMMVVVVEVVEVCQLGGVTNSVD